MAQRKKTGGRQKGTLNRITLEVKALCQGLLASPKYLKNLQRRLDSGKVAPAVETTVWHYAYGKPKERVEHSLDRKLEDILAESRQ